MNTAWTTPWRLSGYLPMDLESVSLSLPVFAFRASAIGFIARWLPKMSLFRRHGCCGTGGRSRQAGGRAGPAPATGKELQAAARFQPVGNISPGVYNPAEGGPR